MTNENPFEKLDSVAQAYLAQKKTMDEAKKSQPDDKKLSEKTLNEFDIASVADTIHHASSFVGDIGHHATVALAAHAAMHMGHKIHKKTKAIASKVKSKIVKKKNSDSSSESSTHQKIPHGAVTTEETLNEKKKAPSKASKVETKIKREKLWGTVDKKGKVTFRPQKEAMESIENKALINNIPVDVLLELYARGYEENPIDHLTPEQRSFNCINSFIAKGKAYRENADLVEAWEAANQDTTVVSSKTYTTVKRVMKKND